MTAPTPAQTQREHDADDLVTEEMVEAVATALVNINGEEPWGAYCGSVRAALNAVAPMIAAAIRARGETK
jgi:hypothetical protein